MPAAGRPPAEEGCRAADQRAAADARYACIVAKREPSLSWGKTGQTAVVGRRPREGSGHVVTVTRARAEANGWGGSLM